MLVGLSWTYVPVPLNFNCCGLSGALSVIEIAPVRVPIVVGLNVIVKVQLAPGLTAEPHVLLWLNGPVTPMLEIFRTPNPVLVRVAVLARLVVNTTCVRNVRLVGDNFTAGLTPTPARETDCGLPLALSEMMRLAVRVPVALGLKVTLIVHAAPGAIDVRQLLVWPKFRAFVPVMPIPMMVRLMFPAFCNVILWEPLVMLTV